MGKSSEIKTLIETRDSPDSNLGPSYPSTSTKSTVESVKRGLVIPVVEIPNPKNVPMIGDGFSDVKNEIKTRRKVKISNSQLTPINFFFI